MCRCTTRFRLIVTVAAVHTSAVSVYTHIWLNAFSLGILYRGFLYRIARILGAIDDTITRRMQDRTCVFEHFICEVFSGSLHMYNFYILMKDFFATTSGKTRTYCRT